MKQNLTEEVKPGGIFSIHLLMEEKCNTPKKEEFETIFKKHLNNVECFSYGDEAVGFAAKDCTVHFEKENTDVPVQLMITNCSEIQNPVMNEMEKTQIWNCVKGEEILESCKYQVIAVDMLASGLEYKKRASMLVRYIEALMELYPTCKAVVFDNSKKMLPREEILNCDLPHDMRFIHYAVNVRFFNIQDTNDMLVDTLGMSTLYLPDLYNAIFIV